MSNKDMYEEKLNSLSQRTITARDLVEIPEDIVYSWMEENRLNFSVKKNKIVKLEIYNIVDFLYASENRDDIFGFPVFKLDIENNQIILESAYGWNEYKVTCEEVSFESY